MSTQLSYLELSQASTIIGKHNLNIISSNCRSFTKHNNELLDMIDELNPEIISLCEMWNPTLDSLNINGYNNPFHSLRNQKRGGGVCLYVKDTDHIKNVNLVGIFCDTLYLGIKMLKKGPIIQ